MENAPIAASRGRALSMIEESRCVSAIVDFGMTGLPDSPRTGVAEPPRGAACKGDQRVGEKCAPFRWLGSSGTGVPWSLLTFGMRIPITA